MYEAPMRTLLAILSLTLIAPMAAWAQTYPQAQPQQQAYVADNYSPAIPAYNQPHYAQPAQQQPQQPPAHTQQPAQPHYNAVMTDIRQMNF